MSLVLPLPNAPVHPGTYSLTQGRRSTAHQPPAAWRGAWVGWLTCQVVLLLVQGDNPFGEGGWVWPVRVVVLTFFVAAFAKPCFASRHQRRLFAATVLGMEAAACLAVSHHPVYDAGALYAIALGVLLFIEYGNPTTLPQRLLERYYTLLVAVTGVVSRLPLNGWFAAATVTRDGLGRRLWANGFGALERQRQWCAHTINHRRRRLA
jgi:hypothetical protein